VVEKLIQMHAFGRKMMKGLYIVRIARQKGRVAAAAVSTHDKCRLTA
jgi:hypothetical protein